MRGETRRFQPLLRHSAGPISAHNQPKSSPRQSLHLTPPSCLLPRSIRPQITFLTDRGPLIRRRSTMAARRGEPSGAALARKHRWERNADCLSEKKANEYRTKGKGSEKKRETKLATCAAVSHWLRAIGRLDCQRSLAHAHKSNRTKIIV